MTNKLNHIAFIADGNGRWAEIQGLPRKNGHEHGLSKIEDVMRWCVDADIHYLSVYVFSLENWNRPKEETDALGDMAEKYFSRHQEFVDNNIQVLISGVEDNLKPSAIEKIHTIQEETKNCNGLVLNLCANYTGHREIVDAIAKGARTEEEITKALYHELPPPDIIVRTGGYQRLSGFMLWQSEYSELYFTHTLWPDLSLGEFRHIVKSYNNTTRKFGGLV